MKKTELKIYDTTLRDGSQSSDINFTLEEKLLLIKEFDKFGFDYIEAGWPRPDSLDEKLFQQAAKLNLKHAKLVAFSSTKKVRTKPEEDVLLKALVKSKVKVATIFGKTWLHHITYQLKATPDENLKTIRDTISYLKNNRINKMEEVIYDAEHFFDGYKDDRHYALKTLKAAILAGADTIVLCDTNGGTLYYEIGEIIRKVREFFDNDKEIRKAVARKDITLGIHTHNDSGLAVANTIEAVRAGASHIQGTVNGIGERVGNANLNTIIAVLGLKTKYKLPRSIKLEKLTALSEKVYQAAGLRAKDDQPFIGVKAFAHDGGVHVDAVLKGASYQHIDPKAVGNKMRIVLSTNSGKASIYGIVKSLGFDVKKDDLRLLDMLRDVHRLCASGFNIGLLEDEHYLLALKYFSKQKRSIQVSRCDVTSHYTEHRGEIEHDNSCILKMDVDGTEYKVFEDMENGPVAVNFKAIKKALKQANLPANFRLLNYEVGLPKRRAGAGSIIQTYITYTTDKGDLITTSGFHEDIIVSSRQSLLKAAALIAEKYHS